MLLQFANVARAACLKHDSYGHPLPDRTKGMIFFRHAKIPGHLEDHDMVKTNGSRNFSDLLEAIQVLVGRPMNQASSSYPSFNDDWTDSTYVTEYYDMDYYHNDAEDGGYGDEHNELEDNNGEWIDMSGILERPDVRRTRVGLYPRQKRVAKATAPKTTSKLKLHDRPNRGWRDQPTRATNKGRSRPPFAQVDDLLTRTRCFKC